MHDHEFEKILVNGTQQLNFADNFNVAVPFIDRHIAAGRGAKPAILTVDGRTESYAELQHAVNRAGNALGALGLSPGDRVLMVVKDCPAFFHIFLGSHKSRLCAGADQYAAARQRLRLYDRRFWLCGVDLFNGICRRGRTGINAGKSAPGACLGHERR